MSDDTHCWSLPRAPSLGRWTRPQWLTALPLLTLELPQSPPLRPEQLAGGGDRKQPCSGQDCLSCPSALTLQVQAELQLTLALARVLVLRPAPLASSSCCAGSPISGSARGACHLSDLRRTLREVWAASTLVSILPVWLHLSSLVFEIIVFYNVPHVISSSSVCMSCPSQVGAL